MKEKVLKEEFSQFRGNSVPLRLVQSLEGAFEVRFQIPGMSFTAPFKQEAAAQAYFEHLKKKFVK